MAGRRSCAGRLPEGYEPVERDCLDAIRLTRIFTETGLSREFVDEIDERREAACHLAEYKKCASDYYGKKMAGAKARYDAAKLALEAAQAAKALCN